MNTYEADLYDYVVAFEITYGGCPPVMTGHPDNWEPGAGVEWEPLGIYDGRREVTREQCCAEWEMTPEDLDYEIHRAVEDEIEKMERGR